MKEDCQMGLEPTTSPCECALPYPCEAPCYHEMFLSYWQPRMHCSNARCA